MLTTAIDLKLDEKGRVNILEFEPSHHAGATGYWALTGKDMLEDIVYPRLRDHFNVPILRHKTEAMFASSWQRYIIGECAPKLPEGKNGYKAICVTPRYYYMQPHQLRFHAFPPASLEFPLMNGHPTFLMATSNKSVANLLIHDKLRDKSITPREWVVSKDYSRKRQFDLKLPPDIDEFVIKLPDESQHTGITIARKDDVYDMLASVKTKSLRKKLNYEFAEEWDTNPCPSFVVQERVRSKPVIHNSKAYDGTMRVFVSAWYNMERDRVDILCHEGYWKLPINAIDEGDYYNQLVSGCPGKLREASDNQLTNFAHVSDEDKETVFATLQKSLGDVLHPLIFEPATYHISKFLFSEDEIRQDAGLSMLSMGNYYQGSCHFVRHGAFNYSVEPDGLSEKLIDRVLDIYCERPYSAGARYLRQLRNHNEPRFCFVSEEFRKSVLSRLPSLRELKPVQTSEPKPALSVNG